LLLASAAVFTFRGRRDIWFLVLVVHHYGSEG